MRGESDDRSEPTQHTIKDGFIENRGYWAPFPEGLLLLSPEFFQAYLKLSPAPAFGSPRAFPG